LAEKVGYANRNAVQLQYGKLARGIDSRLGVVEPPVSDHFIGEFWGYVLSDVATKPGSRGHTAYTLRSEVIAALKELRWIA